MVTRTKKTKKRPYVLRARGERVADTRARIVEAITQWHREIGPWHTTVSAIADRAGVERLTVSTHFKVVFSLCNAADGSTNRHVRRRFPSIAAALL